MSTQQTLKTPHYRIDDPHTGLAVEFRCLGSPAVEAPKIVASLVPVKEASIFMTRQLAIDFFARYLRGQPLDIVRIDAAVPA